MATACCHMPDGQPKLDSPTLGPLEDQHSTRGVIRGRSLTGTGGFRRCSACGARHYIVQVDPIQIGITLATIG